MRLSSTPVFTIATFGMLLGICATLCLKNLPSLSLTYTIIGVGGLLIYFQFNRTCTFICIVVIAFAFMCWHVNNYLKHVLPLDLEAKKLTIVGDVSSIVEFDHHQAAKFVFTVRSFDAIENIWQLPAKIQLRWDTPAWELHSGDKLQLQVKLKRPRNFANPGGFDAELYYLQNRLVAHGYVINSTTNRVIAHDFWHGCIDRIRQKMLSIIENATSDPRHVGIFQSLVVGSKKNIPKSQLDILQATGTIHLLAISGLHLGIVAGIMYFIFRCSVPWIPGIAVASVCIVYALIAGFSPATQRSLIMLLAGLWCTLFKRKISSKQNYCIALCAVLLWDPFAVLSVGFWFSFLAVGLLLYTATGKKNLLKTQATISLGLMPISLLFFDQNSLIGPLANLIMIPWVSFVVLPGVLLATCIYPLSEMLARFIFYIASKNIACMLWVLQKLAVIPAYAWVWSDHNATLLTACAILGVTWVLFVKGMPRRWLGLGCLAPLFLQSSSNVPFAHARFTLLDVGQGLAAVVRTKNHVLIYDTGAKLSDHFDLGAQVVVPFVRTQGIKNIDMLMISHADNDHIGGAESLMRSIPTQQILISDVQSLAGYGAKACIAGQSWQWDGVQFMVLHPQPHNLTSNRNDRSCVLLIQTQDQKLLLTGDIEKHSEQQLIARYGARLQADILLVPHHGSKTSSSLEFLQQVRPKYALIPSGYKNQYGHPKPEILDRYQGLGINILRTDLLGAISFSLGRELVPELYRPVCKRFWHS